MLLLPVVCALPALAPMAMLPLPAVLLMSALCPKAVLSVPVSLICSAKAPVAVLLLALLLESAENPVAVLPRPAVLFCSAKVPLAVLPVPVLLESAPVPIAVLLDPMITLGSEIVPEPVIGFGVALRGVTTVTLVTVPGPGGPCWARRAGWSGGSGGACRTGVALRALRTHESGVTLQALWPCWSLRASGTRWACRALRTCWPRRAGWAIWAWRTRWSLGHSFVLVQVLLVGVCHSCPMACQSKEKKGHGHCESRTSFVISHGPVPVRYDSTANLISLDLRCVPIALLAAEEKRPFSPTLDDRQAKGYTEHP